MLDLFIRITDFVEILSVMIFAGIVIISWPPSFAWMSWTPSARGCHANGLATV